MYISQTLGIFTLLVHGVLFFSIAHHGLMMDEHYHYGQIQRFMHGDFRLDPELPMSPGYHVIISGISWLLGLSAIPYYPGIPFVRFVTWCISIMTIVAFSLCAYIRDKHTARIRTLLYSFFPIFLPFYSLLYTDLTSLACVLCSFWLLLKRRYLLSGIVMAISIAVRQNNIIWAVCFVAYWYISVYGYHVKKTYVFDLVQRQWMIIFSGATFFSLMWVFGGVSSGGQTHVRAGVVVPQNLYLFLFLFFIFFFPVIVPAWRAILTVAVRLKWYLCILPFVYLFFAYTFQIEHPYNRGSFFIHNAILEYFTVSFFRKLIFFLPMVVSVLYLASTVFHRVSDRVWYVFVPIFFLPLWFIEQRYTMIPFALYLLFRPLSSRRQEYVLFLWNGTLSLVIYWGMHQWKFFW